MKIFRISSLTLIGVPRSSIRKISSCPGNLEKYKMNKMNKILNEQSIESVIEETVEIYQDNDLYLKLLTLLLFTFTKSIKTVMSYKLTESKIKEVIIRMTIQYFIHEFFHLLKPLLPH
jgi:hypothetical protein